MRREPKHSTAQSDCQVPTFLGIRTCARRCKGCKVFAVSMWLLAIAGISGFTAMLTAAFYAALLLP